VHCNMVGETYPSRNGPRLLILHRSF